MRNAISTLILIAPLALGCASSGTSPQQGSGSSRNVITREQLEALPSISARDAIDRLHRQWLRGRGSTIQTSTGRVYPKVFLDNRPYGELDVLRGFGTEELEEIRYISASDATTRFGTGYPGGIINLITRRLNT